MEKKTATHSSILASEIPGTEEPGRTTVPGVTKSWTQLSNRTHTHTSGPRVFLKLAFSFQLQPTTHKVNTETYCTLQNVSHKASWTKCKDLTIRMKVGEPSLQGKVSLHSPSFNSKTPCYILITTCNIPA